MYIYPENLKGESTLFLWALKDMLLVIIGAVVSATLAAIFSFILPMALVGAYAFLTLRIGEERSIFDYIRFAFRYFVMQQQTYFWRRDGESSSEI